VDQKIAFIDNLYIDSLSTDLKMFKKVTADILKLEGKQAAVKRLRENLNITISRYQKLLIKDIEIPFYIYSGKVLQAHQSGIGNGIFIKDKTGGDILKNIRFVSNWDSDHDVLNTMSSGQIAAIVITLYLALNKVYAQGFGCLLIDDPVQTMDEINMISLVELLRNEFSDRQIILSTHEDHVSKYFLYKFLKYHLKVRQIKLIDRKEFQLSNPINRPLVSA
jgi:exonuclease SbcC